MTKGKKIIFILLTIIITCIIFVTGTFAYLKWASANRNVVFSSSGDISEYIIYDEGESKFLGDFTTGSSYTSGIYTTISIAKTEEASEIPLYATINLTINEIGENTSASNALKYTVTRKNNDNTKSVISSGNLHGAVATDNIEVARFIEIKEEADEYTIWIWLDGSEEVTSGMSAETLDASVWTEISQEITTTSADFEIINSFSEYQLINATAVDGSGKITAYAVTTTNSCNSVTWNEISEENQKKVFKLENYITTKKDDYYVCFKNTEDETIITPAITVSKLITTGPTCTWGEFSKEAISDGETTNITMTCSSVLEYNNSELTEEDFAISPSGSAEITLLTKTKGTDGYNYNLTIIGNASDGADVSITLPANKLTDVANYGNASTSSPTLEITSSTTANRTPKLLLLSNNTADYIYDAQTYTKNETYGESTITNIYVGNSIKVPIISNDTEKGTVETIRINPSFKYYAPTNMSNMFADYTNVVEIKNINLINTTSVKNMSGMFWNTGSITNNLTIGNLSNWNTSTATNMAYMFYYTGQNSKEFTLDLSNWDTTNVTNMANMFRGSGEEAKTWTVGNLSNWNTSKVKSMWAMFDNTADNKVSTWSIGDISNWDTSNVTTMARMFYNAGRKGNTTWTVGNLSNWNTSSVVNTSNMFSYAGKSATTWSIGDISNWDTSNVTRIDSMFRDAGSKTTTFDIGNLNNWDTSKVIDMSHMFRNAGESSTTWNIGDIGNWNTANTTDMSYMFEYAGGNDDAWDIGNLNNWDTSNITNMAYMFYWTGMSNPTWPTGDLSNWNTSKVTNMANMFSYAGYYATTFNLNLSNWNTSNVTDMSDMFSWSGGEDATTWNIGDIGDWNTSNVTDMSNMFHSAGYSTPTWNIGDIGNWNTSNVTDMSNMFSSAGWNATTFNLNLSNWNTSNVTNMAYMFEDAGYFVTTWSIGNLSNWNISNVTNMSNMFHAAGRDATTWNIGDIGNWNTSNVTDMSNMFHFAGYESTTWSIGNLSNWNTSNVTNMSSIFGGTGFSATTWTIGDISNWDISNVTRIDSMFRDAGSRTTTFDIGNLNNWNTSKVTDMSYMFSGAGYYSNTLNLNLSNWNTINVTNMANMFSYVGYYSNTLNLNLSNWDISNATNMSNMFDFSGNYSNILNLNLSNWNTSSITNFTEVGDIFYHTGYYSNILNLNLSNWNTSNVTNMANMFYQFGGMSKNLILNLSSWDTSNVTSMANMFRYSGMNATSMNIYGIENWNVSNVGSLSNMFKNTGKNVTTFNLDLSNWNVSNVKYFTNMFSYAGRNATTWNIGNLSNWNTSNATSLTNMFQNAGYESTTFNLNLSNWDTSNVTNMSNMFANAGRNATTWSVDGTGNWNTSKVLNMAGMFSYVAKNSTSLINLNLSSWNTSQVTGMSNMFDYANRVEKIYVGGEWSIANVKDSGFDMFYGCRNLVGGNGTVYSGTYTNKTYARIDGDEGQGYLAFNGLSSYTISVSSNNTSYGTVSGGGSKTTLTDATVTATPASGYGLIGWYENDELVSINTSYTFKVYRNRTIEARFAEVTTITASSENTTYGTVSGGGTYAIGREITLKAERNTGYKFTGWYNGSSLVSSSKDYTFTVEVPITLTAHFEPFNQGFIVELDGFDDYGFEQITDPTGNKYHAYSSLNTGVNYSNAVMKVTFVGYTEFTIYINSYAESNYDYTIVGNLDNDLSTTLSNPYATTENMQYDPDYLSSYTEITYTPTTGTENEEHYFYIAYIKDGSGLRNDDKGYILINPNQ